MKLKAEAESADISSYIRKDAPSFLHKATFLHLGSSASFSILKL
jgi:hypothetical protein